MGTRNAFIVPMKPANRPEGAGGGKEGVGSMEPLEGKVARTPRLDEGSDDEGQGGTGNPPRNQTGEAGNPPPTAPAPETLDTYTKLERIAQWAKQSPQMAFTSLNHCIDLNWMNNAFFRTQKDAAPGADGVTAKDYLQDLQTNLRSLIDRAKSGSYRAPAVRRVHIPKGDGKETRPIGIPTFEDKVLQRAVVMLLEALYEQDFLPCSYGFRPGRSAHQALAELWKRVMAMKRCWVVEVDIRKFFDTLDHSHLRAILRRRVQDGVILRLIDKWLNAGVLEAGNVSYPEAGTPQGGVISPLLANVYLHEVLDVWFEQIVKPILKGRAFLIRYADDFVMGFECEQDARRVLNVLPKRFGKYGLTLHPTKTRLVEFGRPRDPRPGEPATATRRPDTFELLGFTHYWGRSRRGYWVVKRKTAKKRWARALRAINLWCRAYRHWPMEYQHERLCQKLKGHYQYYGLIGNWLSIHRLERAVTRVWLKWLRTRSQKRPMTWARLHKLLERFPLPRARIAHAF